MATNDARYFVLLKQAIVKTFRESHPAASESIGEWKGQTIYQFQDDLMEKVRDQVSEKWFYTHMKGRSTRVPRVDILNMLSRYAGFEDWSDFRYRNELPVDPAPQKSAGRVFVIVPAIVLVAMVIFVAAFKLLSSRNYTFCFVNRDDPTTVPADVRVTILQEDESPLALTADSSGCVQFKTDAIRLRMAVSAPLFKTDTISRTLKKLTRLETIHLVPDDYALMLNYFFTNNTDAWQKRRAQLDMMFADSAKIFEVYRKGTIGLELYDKWDFINKLSIPAQSNRQIDILETQYEGDRIISLRFTNHAK